MEPFKPTITQVHADERGEIYVINLPGDQELVLLHSLPGTLRGGHSHDVDEVVVMLTGKMKYHKRYEDKSEAKLELKGGDSSFNRSGVHHMGEFLEDSWVLEWKIGTKKGAWSNFDYAPWREQVRASGKS